MLRIEMLNKTVGDFSLKSIDLTIDKGDYFLLIGKSGAGKSMLLDLIAGLMSPDSGRILFNGKNLLEIPIQNRKIGIVYQKPTLFPHMSVFENIKYPLRIRKLSNEAIDKKINQIADLLDISHLLGRSTTNLSGGETQRVTIARTLVTDPEILLLDEPLTFLDVNLRKEITELLRKLNQQGLTIVHVTHDYESVLSINSSIAIIENGEIVQSGSVYDVFHHPKSSFIAEFIGLRNYYKGKIISSNLSSINQVFINHRISFYLDLGYKENQEVYLIIPDEAITLILTNNQPDTSKSNTFRGIVKDIYQTNNGLEALIDIGIEIYKRISHNELTSLNLINGSTVILTINSNNLVCNA